MSKQEQNQEIFQPESELNKAKSKAFIAGLKSGVGVSLIIGSIFRIIETYSSVEKNITVSKLSLILFVVGFTLVLPFVKNPHYFQE